MRVVVLIFAVIAVLAPLGCEALERGNILPEGARSFESEAALVRERGEAIVLNGGGGAKVLVSPRLQGRILTLKVGPVESVGFVNEPAVKAGETDPRFNNFGGLDRFWLYPEGGPFGLYFPPGAEFTREVWKVPADLDQGAFPVTSRAGEKLVLSREMEVTNYAGTRFKVGVTREIEVVEAPALAAKLGVEVPAGIHYAGVASTNTLTNRGAAAWDPARGLIGIWVLGQFQPTDETVIIAPFRPGTEAELGPPYNDDYFGKVSFEAPERFKVLGSAVLFRADARREGKFGLGPRRTTGLAGSYDFARDLLTVVQFDLPAQPEPYANSMWVKDPKDPYEGDPFQSYNAGAPGQPGALAPAPFYELESTSPVRALKPGENIRHRHATFVFQGEREDLAPLARKLLGVDLAEVKKAMLP